MPPKTMDKQQQQQPKPTPPEKFEKLDDPLPEALSGLAEAAQELEESRPEPQDNGARTEVEELARLLCSADGDDPDNYRNGKPRWQHYEYHARQHIAAFEFLCGARGVEGIDL